MNFVSDQQRKAVMSILSRSAYRAGKVLRSPKPYIAAGALGGTVLATDTSKHDSTIAARYGLASLGLARMGSAFRTRAFKELAPGMRRANLEHFRLLNVYTKAKNVAVRSQLRPAVEKALFNKTTSAQAFGNMIQYKGLAHTGAIVVPLVGAAHLAYRRYQRRKLV